MENELITLQETAQYVKNGGPTYMVKSVDKLRDGGTIRVDTTINGQFYIVDSGIYKKRPFNGDNKLTDKLSILYLKEGIRQYVMRGERHIQFTKSVMKRL